MSELKIEYVPINSIKPYENNAKLHPDEQIEQIKQSIRDVGFRDPIGVWKGVIVEGHGRYIAADEMGMEEVPIIRLDDMTDEQRKEYMLVHNKLTMNSGWDFSALQQELDDLKDKDIDMTQFGFSDEDLDYIDNFFDEGVTAEGQEEEEDEDDPHVFRIQTETKKQTEEIQKLCKKMDIIIDDVGE